MGLRLAGESANAMDFLIHEAGCLRYRDWNHQGIVSPYWRLHYNFSSGNSVVSGRTVYPLHPRVAVLTPAGVRIDTLGPRDLLHLWIHFTPTRGCRLVRRVPVTVRISASLRMLTRELAADFQRGLVQSNAARPHHLSQAVLHGVFAGLDPTVYRVVPTELEELLVYVESNPEKDLSVTALAKIAGRSRSRFAVWFKTMVDETPAEYVQRLRIRLAATRLGEANESIESIAAATGFANRYHFTRVFAKLMGVSPAAYRKRHRCAIHRAL